MTAESFKEAQQTLLLMLQASARKIHYEKALQRSIVQEFKDKYDLSWEDIGKALGVTRQAAQQRFGPHT